ncbi:FliA/WhiG family RNA polymerase sigma factor [Desulfosporosinus nitroreducens]|uniref:FliA/WhiG family RNA polymerase sigma factor n=1 Tax=Desulfosporosinus nitroreducens TaxID=2018668 RepID=A0ABT8QMC5_9FIRM|nr:FliA/WhiG family RNA polymerase sigma factor [Desulfosporosinus nitroreducens]MCO1601289.1 FliA/WhiG family RNA polymerase sigma factor [Desulfosporosinus nitroreducens]MDO0821790.1 FliA/WhiG family RNA polymerase sigma factor [Desulfosporosinus nitroreducens]
MPNAYEAAPRGPWKQEYVEKYLPLVKRIAGRLAISLPSHVDEDDIIGYGVFGLLDALERFEAARGWKFETYASIRIRGAMIDGLRTMDWVPHSARQKVKRVQEGFAELEYQLGRAVTAEEVAELLKVEVREIEGVMAQAQILTLTSFDETTVDIDGDNSGTPLNLLVDPSALDAYQDVEKDEQKQILAIAVDKLPDKEKLVVALYYQEELTLKEIAAVMKLSESRISQLHSQAILRLRGRLSRQKRNLF